MVIIAIGTFDDHKKQLITWAANRLGNFECTLNSQIKYYSDMCFNNLKFKMVQGVPI